MFTALAHQKGGKKMAVSLFECFLDNEKINKSVPHEDESGANGLKYF